MTLTIQSKWSWIRTCTTLFFKVIACLCDEKSSNANAVAAVSVKGVHSCPATPLTCYFALSPSAQAPSRQEIFAGAPPSGPSPTHMDRAHLNAHFVTRLEAWFEIQGGCLKHTRLERAKMATVAGGAKVPRCSLCVDIRTENRRGHHCTVVRGLELLGLNADAFAEEMKMRFAASTSVQEVGKKDELGRHYEVMMQGFWDKTLAEYFVEQCRLPKVYSPYPLCLCKQA